jgi:hypothetical protein
MTFNDDPMKNHRMRIQFRLKTALDVGLQDFISMVTILSALEGIRFQSLIFLAIANSFTSFSKPK